MTIGVETQRDYDPCMIDESSANTLHPCLIVDDVTDVQCGNQYSESSSPRHSP